MLHSQPAIDTGIHRNKRESNDSGARKATGDPVPNFLRGLFIRDVTLLP